MSIELSLAELDCLIEMHKSCAEYALACKQTQTKIANTDPLHKFGNLLTRQDWVDSVEGHDKRRKYHRDRSRYFSKIKELQQSEVKK